jgi:hypothetical protein
MSNDHADNANVNDDNVGAVDAGFDWGAEAIGKTIGRTTRQAHHLLSRGEIKCAVRKGGRWVANRARLRAEFGG